MSSRFYHRIRMETCDGITLVYLDDNEVKGCVKADVILRPNEIPIVKLELIAFNICVDADKAIVITNEEDKAHE